ncbi:arsenite efflux ATP-binding protein ArsA [Geodermatophilus tzadiensis]|uniref:Arsenite efflux ATP-binding protein ArsA n=1 Tax=Geodermatophilus tzadiensis TaxID=1137988 RepID=A0A2T0TXW9_9ACTN|nr:ArsA-related P-loop ATPase [Geodermatophilus tzadiensis]PRY50480.1 arsenite efflux ATP-binding protein ArsA [Geodermatophilus tzadiensis]
MPTLLFTGPGGAGTTTLAAAAAVRAARAGRRSVLVTGQRPPSGAAEQPGVEVVRVDPQADFGAFWAGRAGELTGAVPGLALPPATSVVPLPGTGELALLAALGRVPDGAHADADTDVVVDAGPLTAAAALVALPGVLRWWLDQALPTRVRVLAAVRTAAVRAGTLRRGAADVALGVVPELEALLDRQTLTDPGATAVWLVAPPRPAAAADLRRAVTALAVHGQRPAGVLVRVLPADGAGDWWAARLAEQEATLDTLAGVAPVHAVPETASAPEDAGALAALLPDLPGPSAAPAPPAPERVEGGWRLTLPLPFAERADLALTRWEDELVVTAAGARRSLRLDALLRRCVVTAGSLTGAGTAAARLEVGFAADPGLWPADLLAAHGGDGSGGRRSSEDAGGDTGEDGGRTR